MAEIKDVKTDWLCDTVMDVINLDEECIKQAGLFGFWAHQEVQCIIAEDNATIALNRAEDDLKIARARGNANMRGMDLATLNKLLKTKLTKEPDVALWKELVVLHPDVIMMQKAFYSAQHAFISAKHQRLDRKNARRSIEAKAQELNNLIYLYNREGTIKDSYSLTPRHVKKTSAKTIRSKAEDAIALQLRKKMGSHRIKP